MSKILLSILSLIIAAGSFVRVTEAVIPFRDVSVTSPYYEAVDALFRQQVISDDGSGLFRPSDPISRDIFVGLSQSVSCTSCLTPTSEDMILYTDSPFIDLKKTNPYYFCIASASKKNITLWYPLDASGKAQCEDGSTWEQSPFCENNKTTRIEAAAMLLRQANLWNDTLNTNVTKTRTITDVSDYWYGYANKAIEVGIIVQNPDNSIRPDAALTRGEFALMAAKMLGYNQCMIPGSDISLASKIIMRSADGKQVDGSNFGTDTPMALWVELSDTTQSYTYTWKAYDSITKKMLTLTGDTISTTTLGIGNWYIDLIVRDSITKAQVSTATTTITVHDGSSIGWNISLISDPSLPLQDIGISNILFPSISISTKTIKNATNTPVIFNINTVGSGPMKYVWDFGDGTKISTIDTTPQTHSYKNPGIYTVTIIATDKDGRTARSTMSVEISGNIDSDGDTVSDNLDACPDVIGTSTKNGCPDFSINAYTKNFLAWSNISQKEMSTSLLGTLGKNTCIVEKMSEKWLIILSPVCDQCPCANKISWDELIRSCDVLFPTILSPDKNTLYSRGPLYQIP